jgi:peptidoglycan/xylan/chitin deacetylase (PgdA/CDA1 family)
MYHSLSDDPENGVAPYYKTNTAPSVFRRQMAMLAEDGYKTLDLMQSVRLLCAGDQPGPKTAILTFDDGYRDFYVHAFPALQEHGFTATVFLPTAYIAEDRRCFRNIECLTWSEIRELRKAGTAFGSHTVNHPELVQLTPAQIKTELVESKAEIERQLGEKVPAFAYPYAFPQCNRHFAETFRDLLIQAGYACCVTTELGRVRMGDDPYRLKRLPVNSLDDPELFRAKLEGGYDWMAVSQATIKSLKGCISSVVNGRIRVSGHRRPGAAK